MISLFTIGFCGKKEAEFYNLLNHAGVKTLVDIRLWRTSRFVPWANGGSLKLMLKERYIYMPDCSPTKELLDSYKAGGITWAEYEKVFNELINERRIEKRFSPDLLDKSCLLCSEKSPEMCHRRLVAEYLADKFVDVESRHL
ncbi:MAG: DUF488 domain-containing protein [Holosporales bacterium]|jgi:uncharacterized protein (DUF488 family)|nr:DUF488 domain-containing protein [Holosporales bacterium]